MPIKTKRVHESNSAKYKLLGCQEDWSKERVSGILIAEFLTTAGLLFFLAAAMSVPEPNLVESSLFTAMLVQGLVQSMIHISGAHFNPAVTLMAVLRGLLSIPMAVLYIVAQLIGAVAGTYLAVYITPESMAGGFAVMHIHPDLGVQKAVITEVIGTAFLVGVVCGLTEPNRVMPMHPGSGPLAVGLTVGAISVSIGKHTMACLNPARAFGPALVMWVWDDHWVFWVGPLLGSTIITLIYRFLLKTPKEKKPKELPEKTANRYIEVKQEKDEIAFEL